MRVCLLQVCLIAVLVGFLAFPSGLSADIIWTGADGTASYSDPGNWSCGGCGAFPNNGGGVAYAATINTMNGVDSVNLDTSPVTINSLVLGGNSLSSTLSTGGNSLTIGSTTSPGSILTIGSSGVLQVQSGGKLAVDTTAASLGSVVGFSNAGSLNVADGTALTLRNSSGLGGVFENDGAILLGTTTGANLILDSAKTSTTFDLFTVGSGVLNLTGSSTISGASGSESLINDNGHTINVDADGFSSGTSTISKLANFTNNATMNIGVAGTTPASPISLVIDTSGTTAGFSNTGSVNVNDGTQLVFRNINPGPTGMTVFNNDGNITLGTGSGAALTLDGAGTRFDLTSVGGTGMVSMSGVSTISGQTGNESLINDVGHTISNSGTGTISNLAGFTNNGTLNVTSGMLTVRASAHLTNFGAGTLTGGTYSIGSGATLQLSAIGPNGIGTLSGASVALRSTGRLEGSAGSDAIATVTSIQNSNLSLNGVGTNATPYTFGALTVSASSVGAVESACGQSAGSALCVQNGSSMTAASLSTHATGAGSSANVVVDNSTLRLGALTMSTTVNGQSALSVLDGGALLVGNATSIGTGSQVAVGGTGSVSIGQGATVSVDLGKGNFYLEGGGLTGGGTLDANLDQTGGTFNPGGDPQSFDITGNYTLDSGVLDFDLAGLGAYDQVHVGGDVTLNGTLGITLDNGFTPVAGDVFKDVLDWGAGVVPAELSFFDSALNLDFSLVQDGAHPSEFDLAASSVGSSAPEPGSLSMIAGAMLIAIGFGSRLRRRWSAR